MLSPWERQRAQHHGYGRAGRVSALARSSCAASRARRSSVEDLLDHRDVLRRNRASLARGVDKPRAPRAAREVATRDNDTVDVLVHADLAGAYISFVPPPWMFFVRAGRPRRRVLRWCTQRRSTRRGPHLPAMSPKSPYSGSSRGASLKKRFLGLPAGAELELRGRARVRLGQPQPPMLAPTAALTPARAASRKPDSPEKQIPSDW